ncbi:MAG TPA: potassium-transporting ATPase subunit F [Planctomycetota bacterium]|nr:potassium-transporting ATPase subunit F [Planctomycetota bacterium]
MNAITGLCLALAVLLAIYLAIALLKPEIFE